VSERCAAATCSDDVRNSDETDVDCGGGCGDCADLQRCGNNDDCVSRVCNAGMCQVPVCFDDTRNGVETSVDCGGPCAPCAAGGGCAGASDCQSGVCVGGTCSAPTCADAVKNGDESDVDCGGDCAACADTRACAADDDCTSRVCRSAACVAPTCADGTRNGDESDVDCGGSCSPCAQSLACDDTGDCVSAICTAGRCSAPTCDDGTTNGNETDVDCGGATCEPCDDAAACVQHRDCDSAYCVDSACSWAQSCTQLHAVGHTESGPWRLDPDGAGAEPATWFYCDMETAGSAWTLVSVIVPDDTRGGIVGPRYCSTLSVGGSCRGHMPVARMGDVQELLIRDLATGDWLVLTGLSHGGDAGAAWWASTQSSDGTSSCEPPNTCLNGVLDPNLSVRATSGFAVNRNATLLQSWSAGGWWLGSEPGADSECGSVLMIAFNDQIRMAERPDGAGCSVKRGEGPVAIFWR
jgi:hypothetical protein